MNAGEIVNLLVDLDDERVGNDQLERAVIAALAEGFTLEQTDVAAEQRLAWIDATFGGTRSGEILAGSAWFGLRGGEPVGVAGYGATGLRFHWLQGWQQERDVGLFGPLEVVGEDGAPALERALLMAAFGSLRDRGLTHALVPVRADEARVAGYIARFGARIVERFRFERARSAVRTTILASGGGTNFQSVLDASDLGLDVRALVVNRADAYALERAKRAGVAAHVHLWDRRATARDRYDAELIEVVARTEPELILLLGWMHVLPAQFLRRFSESINIHPAFLPYDPGSETVTMPDGTVMPAFRGAHAVRDALAAGARWYGATAHRVSLEFDRGTILQRAPQHLDAKEEEAALAALRSTEQTVLLGAIRRMLSER